jgi:hypothetical protein
MKLNGIKLSLRILLPLALVIADIKAAPAQAPPPEQAPVSVAGKWTIYSTSDDGRTATKYIDLKQDGEKLSGHFKGPNQSGGLEGTVEGNHIVFHTKTRNVLTFRGQLDGDRMRGTYGVWVPRKGQMHGDWEARRPE